MNLLDNTGTVTKFWQRNYYEHVIRDEPHRPHGHLPQIPRNLGEDGRGRDEDDENPINQNRRES